jgi:hypothetical protein
LNREASLYNSKIFLGLTKGLGWNTAPTVKPESGIRYLTATAVSGSFVAKLNTGAVSSLLAHEAKYYTYALPVTLCLPW